jgi:hypothetical protein
MKTIYRHTYRQTDCCDRKGQIEEKQTEGNLKCPNYEKIHIGGQKDRQIPDKKVKTDGQAKNNGIVRLP